MKLKKLHLIMMAVGTVFCNMASAQLFIDQATFTIQSGATVTVQGDVTSNVDILGTGKVVLKGSANQNVNMGGFSIPNLEIDNTANATLTGNAKVAGDVLFTNGKILLGNNNLALGTAATITNATNVKYVVTNGTGRLIKAALGTTAFNFPIGNSLTAYDPLSIANTGTADSIGARASATVLSGGITGTAFTKEVVNNTWTITEAVAGGSNLAVTATWNAADELSFDRTRGGLSYYMTAPVDSVGWSLFNSQTGTASGAGPYSYTKTGVTSVGTFAVGTRPVLSPLLVTPKVFLQGAYNTSTSRMGDNLRTANLIPLTEPYSASSVITAAIRGSGGGETAVNTIIGSAAGVATDNTIVDWVVVQLHNSGTNAVISQRAALLQRDGDVVDIDGVSPVNMAGNPKGSYFVSVRHRNHLGVRTAAAVALAKISNTNYNFTTALNQAFAGVVTNNAMTTVDLANTVFGMWGGDATGNKVVRYTGPGNDENQLLNTTLGGNKAAIVNGYSTSDLNLNGNVRYAGPSNDENVLLNTVLKGNKAAIINQPNF